MAIGSEPVTSLVTDPIDPGAVVADLQAAAGTGCGAAVLFVGLVRDLTDGRPVVGLEYEAHAPLAAAEIARLAAAAGERWPLGAVRVVHRTGNLSLGDAAVAVAVAAPHRAEAFAAAQWLMDEIKRTVPVWKRERWADGAADWVHPGAGAAS